MALFIAATALTACSDDDDNDGRTCANPEQEVTGTYTGIWKQILDNDTTYAENAVVEMAATDSAYCVDVTVKEASTVKLTEMKSVANITRQFDHGYQFTNYAGSKTGFGVSFSGSVNESNVLELRFIMEKRDGKKRYTYQYIFTGLKN